MKQELLAPDTRALELVSIGKEIQQVPPFFFFAAGAHARKLTPHRRGIKKRLLRAGFFLSASGG